MLEVGRNKELIEAVLAFISVQDIGVTCVLSSKQEKGDDVVRRAEIQP